MRVARSASFVVLAPLLAFLAIGALSLVPGDMRPHTTFSGQAEHFLAYCLVALALCLQQRTWPVRIALVVALCLYAGVLETLQMWVPGRHSQLIDFAASASGAICGFVLGGVAIGLLRWFNERAA